MRLDRLSSADRLTVAFVTLALVWGAFLAVFHLSATSSFLDAVENLTVDWRFRLAGPSPPPHSVVIAAIDDETVRDAGVYPPPRDVLAKIIRGLAERNPRAIAVDIALLEKGDAAADEALAAALRSTKTIVAAIGLFERSGARNNKQLLTDLSKVAHPSNVLWPASAFRAASKVGVVSFATDSGSPRFLPVIYRTDEGVTPSFALAAASAALDADPKVNHRVARVSTNAVSLDLGYHLPIRFYGPRGSFRQFSVHRLLQGDLDAADVKGRTVLLGVTAPGLGDVFATPFDRDVPGVEILATGVANLIANDALVRSLRVRQIDGGAAIALPLMAVVVMARRRAMAGVSIAGLLGVAWAAIAFLAFLHGLWLSLAIPFAALLPIMTAYGVARQALERRVADRLSAEKAALSRFQSPALLEHILHNPDFLNKPVEQNVAVLFLDLTGFTGAAEARGAMWARDFLAEFQSIVARDVTAYDGFIVSFIGDGAMIVFGLPTQRQDDATRALLAAISLRDSVERWLEGTTPSDKDRLSVRVGGHFGPAVVSRLGAADQQHIAATGDTVNVASRLLEAAKQRERRVILSDELVAASDRGATSVAEASDSLAIDIRGRNQRLQVRMWR